MKIVIDEKIPYLRDALEAMGHQVVAKAGTDIVANDVREAGALFVRTRTCCNASLLDGSSVRFIATATIGYDHIDDAYCRSNGIFWCSAPACNAGGVVQYVQSVIYSRYSVKALCGMTLGVVGAGAIGSRVAAWAKQAGMRVLLNDPPLEAAGRGGFVSLETIVRECDVITFHPTLTRNGAYPSYHLADENFFASLVRKPLVINASRGAVVDNVALLHAYKEGYISDFVLDVWEGEPEINKELLAAAYVATPHIAGYSAEGKFNATHIVLQRFAEYTGFSDELPLPPLPAPENPIVNAVDYADAALKIYNPLAETSVLKGSPHLFEELRNNYKFRREPAAYSIVLS